jgi:hypothetical protein
MKKILNKSRGQIAVLYAAALAFVLVGALALGTDVAVMYVNWQHSQKTVDAAAIAGANYLNGGITYADPVTGTPYTTSTGCTGEITGATPEAVATQVACTYAVKNGLDSSNVTITPTATTIQVAASESTFPYFFGKALGLGNYTVASSATSTGGGTVQTVLGSLNTTTTSNLGLVPLGLQCTTPCPSGSFVAGQSVSFGQKFINTTIDLPGNWGWLDLDGSGGAGLKNDLKYGATTSYTVGQTVNTDPGAKVGPIKQGLDFRFAGCPSIADPCNGGNPSDIPAGDPCLVVVPVVDFAAAAKAGKTGMPIEAFAEVYLEPTGPDQTTSTHIGGCYVSAVQGGTLSTTTTTTTGTSTTFLGSTAPPTLTN